MTGLFLAIVALAGAQADRVQPSPDEMSGMENCFAAYQDGSAVRPEAASCIGEIALACQQEPEMQTTRGMAVCFAREREAWQARLATIRNALGLSAEDDAAWAAYRDAQCALEAAEHEGGTLAPVAYAVCDNRLTALRAMELQAAVLRREAY